MSARNLFEIKIVWSEKFPCVPPSNMTSSLEHIATTWKLLLGCFSIEKFLIAIFGERLVQCMVIWACKIGKKIKVSRWWWRLWDCFSINRFCMGQSSLRFFSLNRRNNNKVSWSSSRRIKRNVSQLVQSNPPSSSMTLHRCNGLRKLINGTSKAIR